MKVCMWGNIAGALKGNTDGGGELQQALLAKALAKCGHEVVIIDYNSLEDFITADGIKVFKIKGWNNGVRIIRTLTHRLPQLYKSLKNQKADVYYCRIRDFRHIFAFWAARKINAKFILGLASDLDALNFVFRLKYDHFLNKGGLWGIFNGIFIEIVYPWLLRKSDLVLVQHDGQKRILRKKNIKSLVFPNLFDPTSLDNQETIHKDFIYVGWLDKRKGFTEFFELVTKSPLHSFKVIGPPRDATGYLFYEKLKSFQNVSLLGELSHSNTLYHIANSKALISTSPMEGFPNIFIEAWAFGIPVLSLHFDPGDIIKRESLGNVAMGNIDKLLRAMDEIEFTEKFASRAKAYVEQHHVLNEMKLREINNIFVDLINRKVLDY